MKNLGCRNCQTSDDSDHAEMPSVKQFTASQMEKRGRLVPLKMVIACIHSHYICILKAGNGM
jgi:hypothetical protein